MTQKSDFTEQQWELVLEGPPTAGLMVITAQHGGMFRETMAMAKAYVEAREMHGESQLLDEIVSAKPEVDHKRFGSPDELRQHGLQQLRDAIALLEQKATAGEVDGYRRFVSTLAEKVAHAHREHGQDVSPAEQATLDEIATALSGAPQ